MHELSTASFANSSLGNGGISLAAHRGATGGYDSRGVHSRGEGGYQERELAEKYRVLTEHLHFRYSNSGSPFEHIAGSYDHDADWHDAEMEKGKRVHGCVAMERVSMAANLLILQACQPLARHSVSSK